MDFSSSRTAGEGAGMDTLVSNPHGSGKPECVIDRVRIAE